MYAAQALAEGAVHRTVRDRIPKLMSGRRELEIYMEACPGQSIQSVRRMLTTDRHFDRQFPSLHGESQTTGEEEYSCRMRIESSSIASVIAVANSSASLRCSGETLDGGASSGDDLCRQATVDGLAEETHALHTPRGQRD